MTNAKAWFNNSLRPRKPEGSLGRTAQDGHLDSHTAPELWNSSVQFKIVFMCSEKPIHLWSTTSLRSFPNVAFETVSSDWRRMTFSRPFKEDHRLALPLSTPLSSRRSTVWCPWLCTAGSVSSGSTLQIFWETSHLWGVLCPLCLTEMTLVTNTTLVSLPAVGSLHEIYSPAKDYIFWSVVRLK